MSLYRTQLTLKTLAMSLAMLFATTMAATASAPGVFPCCYWGGCCIGINGGGSVATDSGTVHFSLFATRMQLPDETEPLIIGKVTWTATDTDGSTTTLNSNLVDEYGWIEGIEGGRWARGTMAVNGEGQVPFVLRAIDGGPPGSGQDTIELAVGSEVEGSDGDAFGYHAKGSLVTGDLQLQFNGDPDEQAACMERQS